MAFDAYRTLLDLVTQTVTGLPTTALRVYESPAAALDGGALPALAVLVRDVDVSDVFLSADTDSHLESHRIGIDVVSITHTRDERDTSSLEVKEAILRDAKPGRLRRYRRTDFEERAEGERRLWVASQRFEIDYDVAADLPGTII